MYRERMVELSTDTCALCQVHACSREGDSAPPAACPIRTLQEPLSGARQAYRDPGDGDLARAAARIEARGYLEWCRVEEIMEFAREMGYRRIGIAFCIGLAREARTFADILARAGFEVVSAVCKVGAIPKEEVGLDDSEKVRPGGAEMLCNPVGQAAVLAAGRSELNVLIGLCVGHDTLFIRHSAAPVTVLVVKDRVLAHNPAGALYCAPGYFRSRWGRHSAPGKMPGPG